MEECENDERTTHTPAPVRCSGRSAEKPVFPLFPSYLGSTSDRLPTHASLRARSVLLRRRSPVQNPGPPRTPLTPPPKKKN